MNSSEYIEQRFIDAGWHRGRLVQLHKLKDIHCNAHNHAVSVLREYAGLHVGEVGAGQECAASDVKFFDRPRYEVEVCIEPWKGILGSLVAVASAHNDHMLVYVDSKSRYYIFTEPDEQLYFGGSSFSGVMQKLILGLSKGSPVEIS